MGCTNHWSPTVRGPWWGLMSLLLVFSLTASMAPTAWAQEVEVETVEEAVVEETEAAAEPAADATAAESEATRTEEVAEETPASGPPAPASPEQEYQYTIDLLPGLVSEAKACRWRAANQ